MKGLKSPISKVASVTRISSEGLALRATGRCFGIHKKNTVSQWENKLAEQKTPLMLYAPCHEFIKLTFEGGELYTVVGKRGEASDSQGWTAVVMERASRFRDGETINHPPYLPFNSCSNDLKSLRRITMLLLISFDQKQKFSAI